MPRQFKIDELLDRAAHAHFVAYASEPGREVDECHQWLLTRGFRVGRTAVWKWMRHARAVGPAADTRLVLMVLRHVMQQQDEILKHVAGRQTSKRSKLAAEYAALWSALNRKLEASSD